MSIHHFLYCGCTVLKNSFDRAPRWHKASICFKPNMLQGTAVKPYIAIDETIMTPYKNWVPTLGYRGFNSD